MKITNTKQKIISKTIFVILAISILVLGFFSSSFAATSDNDIVSLSGFVSIILMLIRAIIAVVLIIISYVIGILVGGQFAALNIETFIFNQYELTSLNVFIGSKVNANANALYENVSKWFIILFGVAIILEILVLIYIAISSVLKTLKQDPKKEAEAKKMIKDYLLGLLVLFGMGVFVIAIILLNNVIVSALYKEVTTGVWHQSLTMELWKSIFSFDIKVGIQSLILYVIISAMGLVFFLYYFKRLLKVAFLIVISPLVAVTYAIDRRSGNAKGLIAWSKMFIYAVLIQVIHALTYVALLSAVIKGTMINSTNFIPSMVLLVSGLKFLWDSETIIGSLFGISADKVQGNTAFLMGMISQAGRFKQGASIISKKAPTLKVEKTVDGKRKLSLKTKNTKDTNIDTSKKPSDKIKEDIKDNIKDTEKSRVQNDKKPIVEKKEITEKDIKQAKQRELLSKVYDKRPLKGLGTAVKEYTITKAKTLSKQTLKRTAKSIGKTFIKGTVGGITAAASHATPQVGMIQGAMAGYQGADWAINKIETTRDKKKYKEGTKSYNKTLTQEAEQLKAIRERKEKLGEEQIEFDNILNSETNIIPKEQQQKEVVDQKEKEQQNIDFEQEFGIDKLEEGIEDIASTSRDALKKSYQAAKDEAIAKFQERTGKSQFKAKEYVEKLQKEILTERDFNYKVLLDVDKNLMHKYLNLITKDKIDDFETNTKGKIKYKEVIKKAREI